MHVTVIAKEPIAGRVKTRLCPPCTSEQAADIATAALADTFDEIMALNLSSDVRHVLLIDGRAPASTPARFDVIAQRGDGLEQRLRHGFSDLGAGLIIGMDTPHAVAGLRGLPDVLSRGVDVLGLAVDGGYWVIGLASTEEQFLQRVFDGMPMSCSQTGLQQLRRLHQLDRRVRLLAMVRDLDTPDDLYAAAATGGAGRLRAVSAAVVATLPLLSGGADRLR